MRPGKTDRGICTSCRRMPSEALTPATAQLDDLCVIHLDFLSCIMRA